MLIRHGANPNRTLDCILPGAAEHQFDEDSHNQLVRVVEDLLDLYNADVHHVLGPYSRPGLIHEAAAMQYPAMVRSLLNRGALMNSQDGSGYTPLHLAVRTHSASVMIRLLEAGADLNARDDSGETPLYTAIDQHYGFGVETLLSYGADPNTPGTMARHPFIELR